MRVVHSSSVVATALIPVRPTPAAPVEAPSYRRDLDGLRGIAIALVVCFHIAFGRVSGGVDVFLTLSGYFFVGSLLRHIVKSQASNVSLRSAINPWPRLKRLVRRLLPALTTVLLVVAVLTILVVPQPRWVYIGREAIASALYFQNWYLAFNSQDYLAASSANSPLQHIWSMSVQGQFFVLMLLGAVTLAGLLKLGARRFPQIASPSTVRLFAVLITVGLVLVSFYWAQMRTGVNQPFNYFDTVSRLWEPLAGGLLALWAPKRSVAPWVRNVAAGIALGMIVTCGWWIDGAGSYPGPWALVPVLSTLVIIWAGTTPTGGQAPALNRALQNERLVWLGGIAYALYLWHWPLLIFYLNWSERNHASFAEGVGLVGVSLLLAWLTKRFIEDPLRGGPPKPVSFRLRGRRVFTTYGTIATAVLVAGCSVTGAAALAWDRHVSNIVVDTRNLDPAFYPGGRALLHGMPVPALDPVPSPLEVVHDFPETSFAGQISEFDDPDIHVAVYGDPNAKRTIALAGGSHAEMWISALDTLGKRNHFRVTTYLKMGCPLSTERFPRQNKQPYPQCYDWAMRTVDRLIADKPDAVFTNSTRPGAGKPGDILPRTYVEVFDKLMNAGIDVIGIRDTPWPHNKGGSIETPACLASGGDARSCGTPRELALARVDPASSLASSQPLFHPIDLSEAVCTDKVCPAIVGNIIVYKDWHHLSATFVRTLTDEVGRQLAKALPWTGAQP